MMNQFMLVGRLASNPTEIENLENGNVEVEITIAIKREYCNANGIYETDYVTCNIWNGIAKRVIENCKKGDLIGVRGRFIKNNKLLAERVTFLANKENNNGR